MRKHVSVLRAAVGGAGLALALGFLLPACGGGGGNGPTPVPTPTPRSRTVLVQNTWRLASVAEANENGLNFDFAVVPFSVSATGDLDVTVDWTFSSNDIDIALLRGNCTIGNVLANQCSTVVESTSATAKPERLSSTSLAAGSYTVLIANWGPGGETGTVQVGLTR